MPTASASPKKPWIFPRYHQWEVVNTLIETTRAEGPGKRYLNPAQRRLRQVQLDCLDGASTGLALRCRGPAPVQLGDRDYRPHRAGQAAAGHHLPVRARPGRGQCITRDIGSQSKSEQLAEALAEQTRIIIVTIQTFPALFDALDSTPGWPAAAMR